MNKISIFLNGARGLVIASKLIKNNFKISNIISPKDHNNSNLIKNFCNKHKINHIISINPNNDKNVQSLVSDLFIIAGYSTIFNTNVLRLPSFGTINLHAGTLPKYRGGSPLNWQIINGEKTFNCSIILTTSKIDNGRILAQKTIKILSSDDIKDVHEKANKGFSDLIDKVVTDIFNRNVDFKAQDEKKAIYWHQRSLHSGKQFIAKSKF